MNLNIIRLDKWSIRNSHLPEVAKWYKNQFDIHALTKPNFKLSLNPPPIVAKKIKTQIH